MKSQAIVAYGQPLQEVVTDTPVPTGTEVIVKVTRCGVCHSDVHIHDGYVENAPGERMDWSTNRQLPFAMGHEIEGTLAAVGPEAEALLEGRKVGERFVVFPWIGCGKCPTCLRDEEHICSVGPRQIGIQVPGGYAEYVRVPHPKYLLDATGVPEGLAATYMCSGITAYSAMRKIPKVAPGESILVVGLGGVGMMGLQFARALYPEAKVYGADIDEAKLEAAKALGAAGVFNSRDPSTLKALRTETGGGVVAATDFVGSTASVGYANGAIRRGGAVIIVGLFGGKFETPIPMFPIRPFSIIGSYTGPLGETKAMMELVRGGKIQPIPIETRPLARATETLDQLREGKIVGRVVLEP